VTLEQKAEFLVRLHHAETPLLLVNVWDAASASIVAHAGFPAIATGSAGVAFALGRPDGQQLEWSAMVGAIERITSPVDIPVTVDIEAGFASDIATLQRNVDDVLDAGAVGINLEDAISGQKDALYPVADQVARIRAVRATADRRRIHLVINARTDAYWRNGLPPETALRNTIERAQLYLNAGADSIFVPGLRDPAHIRTVVEDSDGPLNIMTGPGVPSVPELTKLGVRRISMGSGPMRAALGTLRRIAHEALTAGTYNALLENPISSAEMNALLTKNRQTETKPA
jgi:2-methylisocitrate lyase-like PEP mutase family enzyme